MMSQVIIYGSSVANLGVSEILRYSAIGAVMLSRYFNFHISSDQLIHCCKTHARKSQAMRTHQELGTLKNQESEFEEGGCL